VGLITSASAWIFMQLDPEKVVVAKPQPSEEV